MPGKLMNFDLPKGQSSIIKVIGVGGGGSNAVNHMFSQGIKGVDFVVCNTDSQALDNSPVPHKIQLGAGLTEGLGAGGDPNVGKNSALENIEQIKEILEKNTQMVFVTAGMGGGTGTGGAPVIAAVAKEMGILTVGIVTIPFSNEGPKRKQQAEEGLDRLRESVDALIIICNDKLREMYGNLALTTAFLQADNVLATAARGIAEMISVHGTINVDFRDVNTVMKDSGVAIMGSGVASGESRAVKAIELALASPLLNDNKIKGASYVLLNITTGKQEPLLDEITEINDYVQQEAGNTANVIMGVSTNDLMEDDLGVTIIAAGFQSNPDLGFVGPKQPEKIVRSLSDVSEPPVVHKLDENDTQAEELKTTVQPDEVPLKASTEQEQTHEGSVIEDTPERKIFSLDPPEKELTQPDVKDSEEVEEDIKLINKEEAVIEAQEVVGKPVDNAKEEDEEEIAADQEELKEANIPEFKLMVEPAPKEADTKSNFEFELSTGSSSGLSSIRKPLSELSTDDDSPLKSTSLGATSSLSSYKSPNAMDQAERISQLKELSYKLRTPSGVSDLENQPAYKRRNVNLENVPHSSDSQVSRITLNDPEEGEEGVQLKPDNPFLHDNVD